MSLAAQVSDAQARELAQQIIRRPEFAGWRHLDFGELPFLAWLYEWLAWVDDWLAFLLNEKPALYWGIVIGLALIAVLMIGHLVWSLRVALRASSAESGGPQLGAGTDFVALADGLAAAGRFLDAAHCLQLACIEQLLQRRLITLSRSEPNRTLRRRIAKSTVPAPEQSSLFRLLDQTETAWFRDRSQDPALYDHWRRMHARLCTLSAAT